MSPWVWVLLVFFGLRLFGVGGMLLLLALALSGQWLGRVAQAAAARARFTSQQKTALANPADFDARHELGVIYRREGRTRTAERYLRQALEIMRANAHAETDPTLLIDCAEVFLRRGQHDEGLKLATEAAREYPSHQPGVAAMLAGRAETARGHIAMAEPWFRSALESSGSSAEAHFRLARCLASLGQGTEASRVISSYHATARTLPAFVRRRDRNWRWANYLFPVTRRFPLP